jgi:hypothetical protein
MRTDPAERCAMWRLGRRCQKRGTLRYKGEGPPYCPTDWKYVSRNNGDATYYTRLERERMKKEKK